MSLTGETFLHILPYCRTNDLLNCGRTCKFLQDMVSTETRRRYFTLLRMYFGDRTSTFHDLLCSQRAIVSGSVALAFFSWTDPWEPGDMDVYVGKSAYARFVHHLERSHLASLAIDFGPRRPSSYHGIDVVRRYITCAGEHLDVIQSSTTNPVTPLLYFWSSLVVNFISPFGAACIFPSATFEHKGFVAGVALSPKILAARNKYVARGFRFTEVTSWRPPCILDRDGHLILSDRPILVIAFLSASFDIPLVFPITRNGRNWIISPVNL